MKNEIILYQDNESSINLEVQLRDETVWLTQAQMAILFETTRNNITLHISNIFKEQELSERSVCKDSLLTAADGKKYKTKLYNLDVIISVGYRVKSLRGTQFRIWANRILKDYLLKGYALNNRMNRIEDNMELLSVVAKFATTATENRIMNNLPLNIQNFRRNIHSAEIMQAAFAAIFSNESFLQQMLQQNCIETNVSTNVLKSFNSFPKGLCLRKK